MREERGLVPDAAVAESGEETIEAASTFETLQQDEVTLADLDLGTSRFLFSRLHGTNVKLQKINKMAPFFRVRGLVWRDGESRGLFPTAGGVVFLGRNPAIRFPQCQVLADAYRDAKVTSKPFAQKQFSGPIPQIIEDLRGFLQHRISRSF